MSLARKVALALVLDCSEVSSAARDVRRVRELNVRASVPDAVNPEFRERDRVLFRRAGRKFDREDSMTDLTDDDSAAAE